MRTYKARHASLHNCPSPYIDMLSVEINYGGGGDSNAAIHVGDCLSVELDLGVGRLRQEGFGISGKGFGFGSEQAAELSRQRANGAAHRAGAAGISSGGMVPEPSLLSDFFDECEEGHYSDRTA